jgi:hypothetical protein
MLRFDARMYQAALAYCGLPADWPRTFTLRTFVPRGSSTPITAPCKTNVMLASCAGLAVWTQINDCDPDAPIRKPKNTAITVLRNVSLDWEFPQQPRRALDLGLDLADALGEAGLALPGQPVDDSGAGPHLILPITPVVTADHGGGALVNDAVERLVKAHILPLFLKLAQRHGLDGQVELGAYDISRVISLAGCWRPGHNKPDDAPFLHDGYLRRWLPPYVDGRYPVRRESARLSALIVEAACALRAERAERAAPGAYRPPPGQAGAESVIDAYNRQVTAGDLATMLEAHGWQILDERADRITLTRPGKDAGESGNIITDQGIAKFYNFSTSAAPLAAGRGYRPFGVYAALEHAGDPKGAVRALAHQGYGQLAVAPGVLVRRRGALRSPFERMHR